MKNYQGEVDSVKRIMKEQ